MIVNLFSETEYGFKIGGVNSAYKNIKEMLNGRKEIKLLINDFKNKEDLVHFQTIGPVSLMKMKTKAPKVISSYITSNDFNNETILGNKFVKFMNWYTKKLYNKADLIISMTEFNRKDLIKDGIKKPIIKINIPINTEKFQFNLKKREIFRKRFNIKNDELVIFGVGRFDLDKDVITFIETAKKFKNYKFVWVGENRSFLGTKKLAFLSKKIDVKIPDNMIKTGYIEDVTEAFSGGDIFFFPSLFENQGLVVGEAQAAGRPVIVRDLPAYEWVNEDECFKAKRNEDFFDAIKKLAESETLRKDYGRRSLRSVKRLAMDYLYKDYLNAYIGVVKK